MSLSAEEKRKTRLAELSNWLRAAKRSSFKRTLGKASLRWGSKSVRVREHLEDLENAGLITIEEKEDRILWIGET